MQIPLHPPAPRHLKHHQGHKQRAPTATMPGASAVPTGRALKSASLGDCRCLTHSAPWASCGTPPRTSAIGLQVACHSCWRSRCSMARRSIWLIVGATTARRACRRLGWSAGWSCSASTRIVVRCDGLSACAVPPGENEMPMVRRSRADIDSRKLLAGLGAARRRTEAEIDAEAAEDGNAWTEADVARAIAVYPPPTAEQVRALRSRLGLSQAAFAQRFGCTVDTLQHAEQGRRIFVRTGRDPAARDRSRPRGGDPRPRAALRASRRKRALTMLLALVLACCDPMRGGPAWGEPVWDRPTRNVPAQLVAWIISRTSG